MKTTVGTARGFSLVEVTLALGVAAFALLVILGLFSVGMGAQETSLNETTATNLATGILTDLQQVPSASAIALNSSLTTKSSRYGVDVTQPTTTIFLDESGTLKPSATGARYKVVINLTVPGNERTATYGSVLIMWPSAAVNPVGSVTVFVALDRN